LKRGASPKLGGYAGLVGLSLLGALVLGLPELVVFGAPFALVLAVGLASAREPRLALTARLGNERALEGDEVTLELEVRAGAAPVERAEFLVALPDGIAVAEGDNPFAVRLDAHEQRELELKLRCERWGAYLLGQVLVRAHDRFGLVSWDTELEQQLPLKVFPHGEVLRHLLRPFETQVFAGNQVSRQKGEGIEFADIRPFAPGDRIRRINWRASARRRELWVNELHAERNADVIIFLDTFAEAVGRRGGTTLDLAVRAAASLASGYLRHKDRVGFVSFGGILNWLLPGTGVTQLYRMVDSLLDTEIILNWAWKDIDVIPARTLPPKALVVALTPLLDERSARALLDLRARGFDLAVVEVSPVPFTEPGRTEEERLSYRIWRLKRDALRARYEESGVAVALWTDEVPFAASLEEVREYRRHARPVRA
jgi:uncharacterized protein (DUF58 family)